MADIGDTNTPLKEPRSYKHPTPARLVVDPEDSEEAGPVDGSRGRGKRLKKPGRALRTPYRQVIPSCIYTCTTTLYIIYTNKII